MGLFSFFLLLVILFLSPTVTLYSDLNPSPRYGWYQMLLFKANHSINATVAKATSYQNSLSLLLPSSLLRSASTKNA